MSWTARQGDRGPAVQRIRAALGQGDSPEFDGALRAAVVAFQTSAGLKPDGIVGARTRAALGKQLPAATTVAQRLAWAAEYDGEPCTYGLGAGGKDPANNPWELRGGAPFCECAAWVAFTLGRAKYGEADWPGWFETTRIVTDAQKHQRLVRPCKPAPGAILVRPDRKVEGKTKQGHMGLVVSVEVNKRGEVVACRISDCTSAKASAGRAIGTRDGMGLLKSGAIFVCPVGDPLP